MIFLQLVLTDRDRNEDEIVQKKADIFFEEIGLKEGNLDHIVLPERSSLSPSNHCFSHQAVYLVQAMKPKF
ncbi:MAG: hypothetical protein ACYDHX_13180 [Methanothrix sp.]